MNVSSSSGLGDPLLTPITRRGPSSRLLKRQSLLLQQQQAEPALGVSSPAATDTPTLLASPQVTRPLYTYHHRSANATASQSVLLGDPRDERHRRSQLKDDFALPARSQVDQQLEATENLFVDFLASSTAAERREAEEEKDAADADAPSAASGDGLLDQVAEYEQLVSDQIDSLQQAMGHQSSMAVSSALEVKLNLLEERNSWRLIGKLYAADSLKKSDAAGADANREDEPMDEEMDAVDADNKASSSGLYRSEKRLVERLFKRERSLRHAQAIVDWLELNAQENLHGAFNKADLFGDSMLGWENTLHTLQQSMTAGRSGKAISDILVTELDPDARIRQRRALHDLDQQDQQRMMKAIYLCVRSGMLDSAQDLCIRMGQPWRAATLVGWKLFHDPNYDRDNNSGDLAEKLPVEGNPNRDVWKRSAWILSQDDGLPAQERAIYSALCGNVTQLLQSVCPAWEDVIWANVRSMVDRLVEQEIRESHVNKKYADLPQEYWTHNKKDLNEVLEAVVHSDDPHIREEAVKPQHLIQTYLMLQDWPKLFEQAAELARSSQDPHLLRFLVHLVLVLQKLDVSCATSEEAVNHADEVLESYIRYLIGSQRVAQVAWYTARIGGGPDRQAAVYRHFLKTVTETADRQLCLQLAEDSALPLHDIRVSTVEEILNEEIEEEQEEMAEDEGTLASRVTPSDQVKIRALEWLTLSPALFEQSLVQTNALARYFVANKKVEAAETALKNVSVRSAEAADDGELADDLKEYFCLQAYVAAKEAFADWFEYWHKGKPRKPEAAGQEASAKEAAVEVSFAAKIALEQREKQYAMDMERWRGALLVQSREVCHRLNAVLRFPEGWMVSSSASAASSSSAPSSSSTDTAPSSSEAAANAAGQPQERRGLEMDYLRRTCLVEIVLLLHTVLHNTGQYKEALKIADVLAAESSALYSVFSKEDMKHLLQKLAESSVQMMEEQRCDPWGY